MTASSAEAAIFRRASGPESPRPLFPRLFVCFFLLPFVGAAPKRARGGVAGAQGERETKVPDKGDKGAAPPRAIGRSLSGCERLSGG